jgi:hypothetical protein
MEIDLGHFYSHQPLEISEDRKKGILRSLEDERKARRACIAQGKKYKLESLDTPSSPLSLHDETRPLKREISPSQRSSLPKFSSQSSEVGKTPETRAEFMHNQLKEPDFEQLSHIYENYLRSPKMLAPVPAVKKSVKSVTTPVRCASAPGVRRKNMQELISEREEEFKKNCTFKPQINKMGYNKALAYNNPQSGLTFEQKLSQLSRPKSETIEQRERQKREKEMQDNSECTFKPIITPYKQVNRSFSEFPVEERLYQDAEIKMTERERRKREKEEEIAGSFPFSPQVQSSVSKLVGMKREKPPLYQRLDEVQKEISEKKKIIKLEAERNDQDLTFRPQINANSAFLAEMRRSRDQSSSVSRAESVERRTKYSADENYTFTPQISCTASVGTKDFLERQKLQQEKVRERREKLIEQMQSGYTFKPNIDKTSQYITDSNKDRNKNKLEERLNSDYQKKQICKQI